MNSELWDGCDKWDEWDRLDGERIVNSELDTSCKLAPAGGVEFMPNITHTETKTEF